MKCPLCKKDVAPESAFAPFCSDRCRLIDLGNWADEKYRIPGAPRPEKEEDNESDQRDQRR